MIRAITRLVVLCLVLLVAANDDHRDVPMALLPDVVIDGFGEQAMDFHYPSGRIEGRVALAADGSRELRVTALPQLPEGFARQFLDSADLVQALGVELDADGGFTLEHVAPGAQRLELRTFAHGNTTLLGTREVEVTGRTAIGTWSL